MTTVDASPLAAHYERHITQAAPFLETAGADVFLIPPGDGSDLDHCAALDALVCRGALTDYRYIGAQPQPAILAIRSRYCGPRGAEPGAS